MERRVLPSCFVQWRVEKLEPNARLQQRLEAGAERTL
jgi:hypothetical protein